MTLTDSRTPRPTAATAGRPLLALSDRTATGACRCSHEQQRHYRGRGVCALTSCPCHAYAPGR